MAQQKCWMNNGFAFFGFRAKGWIQSKAGCAFKTPFGLRMKGKQANLFSKSFKLDAFLRRKSSIIRTMISSFARCVFVIWNGNFWGKLRLPFSGRYIRSSLLFSRLWKSAHTQKVCIFSRIVCENFHEVARISSQELHSTGQFLTLCVENQGKVGI